MDVDNEADEALGDMVIVAAARRGLNSSGTKKDDNPLQRFAGDSKRVFSELHKRNNQRRQDADVRDDVGWTTAGEHSSKSNATTSSATTSSVTTASATTSSNSAAATTTTTKAKAAHARSSMAKPRQLASLAKEATEAAKTSTKNLRVTTNRPAPRKAIYAGLTTISAFNKQHVASIYQTMSRRTWNINLTAEACIDDYYGKSFTVTDNGASEQVTIYDPRQRQREREARDADPMRRAVLHVHWLPHHVSDEELVSFIDGLKANTLTISEVTWERCTEEGMEHIASGVRRIAATYMSDQADKVDGIAGIHFIGTNRCNITKAGLKKCTFCEEIGHYIRDCKLATLRCTACKQSGHQAEKCTLAERLKAINRGKKYRGQELEELPAEEELTAATAVEVATTKTTPKPATATEVDTAAAQTSTAPAEAGTTAKPASCVDRSEKAGLVYDAFDDKFILAPTAPSTSSTTTTTPAATSTPTPYPPVTTTAAPSPALTHSAPQGGIFTTSDLNRSFQLSTNITPTQRTRGMSSSSSTKRSRQEEEEEEDEEEGAEEEMDAEATLNTSAASTSTAIHNESGEAMRRKPYYASAGNLNTTSALNSSCSSNQSTKPVVALSKSQVMACVERLSIPKHAPQAVGSQLSTMPPPPAPTQKNSNITATNTTNKKKTKTDKTPTMKIRDMTNQKNTNTTAL